MNKNILSEFKVAGIKTISLELRQAEATIEEETEVVFAFDIGYQNPNIDISDGQRFGNIDLTLNIKGDIEKTKEELLLIHLVVRGCFTADEAVIDRETFEEMVRINGVVALMHHARSLITATSSLAGITPPIILPLVNVLELDRAMQKKGETKEIDKESD